MITSLRLVTTALVLILCWEGANLALASSREKWGPFAGQVVDIETGHPIAGAVILVVWRELYGFGFVEHRFYEAHEAVTDANGRWEVPKLSAPPWKMSVQEPEFHLFAAGYEAEADVVTPKTGTAFVDPTVTQVRWLKTPEELKAKLRGYPTDIPAEKMPAFLKAVNAEIEMLSRGRTRLPWGPRP